MNNFHFLIYLVVRYLKVRMDQYLRNQKCHILEMFWNQSSRQYPEYSLLRDPIRWHRGHALSRLVRVSLPDYNVNSDW